MKTLSLINIKGGVGKTTLSLAIAYSLAKNNRVLLIDTDPQCSLSICTGQYDNKENVTNLFLCQSVIPTKIAENLHIIPSSWSVVNFGNSPESTLRDSLKHFANFYDYCIIDAPGSMTSVTRNAIKGSDKIIIPACLSFIDADATGFTLEQIERMEVNAEIGVVLNKTRSPKHESESILFNAAKLSFTDNPKYPAIGFYLLESSIPQMQSLEKITAMDDYKLKGIALKHIEDFISEVINA